MGQEKKVNLFLLLFLWEYVCAIIYDVQCLLEPKQESHIFLIVCARNFSPQKKEKEKPPKEKPPR